MPAADPTIPTLLTQCDDSIPVLPVVRSLHFGQFITLYYGESGHADQRPPLEIVIHRKFLPTIAQSARLEVAAAAEVEGHRHPGFRQIEESNVDLFRILESATSPVRSGKKFTVKDMPAFLATGIIENSGKVYQVAVDDDLEWALSAGYSVSVEARTEDDAATIPILLVPYVPSIILTTSQVDQLIAGEAMKLDLQGVDRRAELSPEVIRALLGGAPGIVRAVGGGVKPAPVLINVEGPAIRSVPSEFRIEDLPAFLAKPGISGREGEIMGFSLTARTIADLRQRGEAEIEVTGSHVRLLVRQSSAATMTGTIPGATPPLDPTRELPNDPLAILVPQLSAKPHPESLVPAPNNLRDWVLPDSVLMTDVKRLPPRPPLPPPTAGNDPPGASKTAPPPQTDLPVALLIGWRQTWNLRGFSRGNLLQSIPMAPQEEVSIELRSWEKRMGPVSVESSTATDMRQAGQSSQMSTDIDDIFHELLARHDYSWQFGSAMDALLSSTGVSFRAGAGFAEAGATDVANIASNSSIGLRQATQKASENVRSIRVTRISQSTESGGTQRVVRKLRNSNTCHPVTYHFFEILAHYDVRLELVPQRTRLVAMVPNPIYYTPFTSLLARTHETALSRALLDPALEEGFAALRLTTAYEMARVLIEEQRADNKRHRDALVALFKTETSGEMSAGKSPSEKLTEAPAKQKPQEHTVVEILQEIHASMTTVMEGAKTYGTVADAIVLVQPLTSDQRRNFKFWLFLELGRSRFPGVMAALERLQSLPKAGLGVDTARMLIAALPDVLVFPKLGNLNEMLPIQKETAALYRAFRETRAEQYRWKDFVDRCLMEGLYTADDLSIGAHCEALQKAFSAWEVKRAEGEFKVSKEVLVEFAKSNQELATNLQGVAADAEKLSAAFPIEDLSRAYERKEALLQHLNDYSDHYNYALFQALPHDEQVSRIVAASQNRLHVGMFEPNVIAMNGRNLAIALTDVGQAAMGSFLQTMTDELVRKMVSSNDPVVVPTPGTMLTSHLSPCSTCEVFIRGTQDHELDKLGALARQELAEASRREGMLATKDFTDPTSSAAAVRIAIEKA